MAIILKNVTLQDRKFRRDAAAEHFRKNPSLRVGLVAWRNLCADYAHCASDLPYNLCIADEVRSRLRIDFTEGDRTMFARLLLGLGVIRNEYRRGRGQESRGRH